MKAQTVKNAVIVPVGSKGGFVSSVRPLARSTRRGGIELHRILIRSLLDLTDNIVTANSANGEDGGSGGHTILPRLRCAP